MTDSYVSRNLGTTFRKMLLLGTMLIPVQVLAQTQTPQPASAAPAPSSTQPEATQGVEDIVVTAQRREQSLQDVPISITALTSSAILANRIQDVQDLNSVAPGLSVRFSTGGAQIPNFTLRGILTGGSAAGTDKGVSLYLDGVYIQSVQGSVFDFADIERIEVLKGPQGTLFGRNATGGAISITTRNPSGEFSARQDLTYGNYDQLRSKTRIETPQIGPFSAIITYLHSQRHGETKNLQRSTFDFGPASGGTDGLRTSANRLGDDNTEAVAVTIKADLINKLDLIYKFDYSQNHYTPVAQGLDFVPAGTAVAQIIAASPNPKTPITNQRPDAVNNEFTTPSYLYNYGHNLTAVYHANDQISFKNILAYRKSYVRTTAEFDGQGGLLTSPIFGGFLNSGQLGALSSGNPTLGTNALGVPMSLLTTNVATKEHQWSNEFQINITTDWFNLTAGYLHFYDHISTEAHDGTYNTYVLTAYDGQNTTSPNTPYVVPGNPGIVPTQVTVNSDAWYVQPEIHITPTIDIVGGLRITRDRKDGFGVFPDQYIATLATGLPSPVSVPVRYRDSEITALLGINWHPTRDILVYAKYADGYISGGTLSTITFQPERAFSYEGGIKTELFNHRLRSNLAVYHVNYKSIQFTTSGLLTGVPSSALFGQAVVSSADARANGFEWENTLVPVNGLTLTTNVGYTDFKFKQNTVFPGFALQSGLPGYQVFARPKWTLNLAAQYESREIVGGAHLFVRADGNFHSKYLLSSDLTVGSGLTIPETPGLRDAVTVPAYFLVNGRLGLTGFDLGRAKVDVSIWGKNITDRKDIQQATALDLGTLGFFTSVIYERARTFGVDLTVSY
jgi:iron complex outermembrane receptor protein